MSDIPVEILATGRFLRLVRKGHWEFAERVNSHAAVFVVAVTPARELVLVEQHRIPLGRSTIELPAGLLGDEARHSEEPPEACALRELEEETGFRGKRAQLIVEGPVAPGLTSERLYLVRCYDLERVHAGGGVGGENITVHTPRLDSIDTWLAEQRRAGLEIEPRVYAALYFLRNEG
ncbi:MAG: NUDIX hydrolase [Nevskiales bacterium]